MLPGSQTDSHQTHGGGPVLTGSSTGITGQVSAPLPPRWLSAARRCGALAAAERRGARSGAAAAGWVEAGARGRPVPLGASGRA